MKLLLILFFTALNLEAKNMGFYDLSATANNGTTKPLSAYAGKVSLVVNVASKCGYTPQYKDLEAIYQKYHSKGFEVLGFPSNDFGAQEPGSNEEIKKFCDLNYKITFPLFAKNSVKGDEKQPVYKYLTTHAAEKGEVKWNFEKFLIDKKGNVVKRFGSSVSPSSPELTAAIEGLL